MAALVDEIAFADMLHRGRVVARKVALQGDLIGEEEDKPLYRTPSDCMLPTQPWSPTVSRIREELSTAFDMAFNQVKIQLYKDGFDHITKHSDKTLDIKVGSSIVNLNLGTTRMFTFENKETNERRSYKFQHNSVIIIGWESNRKWTHSVQKDPQVTEKRISFVFRQIETFITRDGQVYGQGAKTKHRFAVPNYSRCEDRCDHYDVSEAKRMLTAFSNENKQSDFDWMEWYGTGFDVYDFSSLTSKSTST